MSRKRVNTILCDAPERNAEDGSPPAKMPCLVNPTTFFKMEIVRDGLENRMQVRHDRKGREYQIVGPGTRFYYTRGAVPGLKATGTARKSNYPGQVILEVAVALETLIEFFLKTSILVRRSVKREDVKGFGTNFFPVSPGPDKASRSHIYVANSKQMPLSSFSLDRECQVYIYPSTLSYVKDRNVLKCRLGAVPISSMSNIGCSVRDFVEVRDASMEIPDSEIALLGDGFNKKWWQSTDHHDDDEDCDLDDVFVF